MNQVTIPAEYKPISAWGYFGYQILFSIPLVGFIMLLVFALGGTENINLKNYARSYFCAFLIGFCITIIVLITVLAIGGLSSITQ
ncbi:MAG: ABC transporter permease [Bacilli bacterium]|nr:ABC transporter permease [Bacilli bacterium]